MSLERAVAAKDERTKLQALVEAWRKHKHPRIAEVLERVAAPLVKQAGGAFKAKSVPERTQACLAALKKDDAVELGRVLETEWPGTWEPALPLVQALCAVKDDPRVAKVFARQIDKTQYDTWTSKTLWTPLFTRFDALADVRQLPVLEAQLQRAKGEYYARDMRSMEERSVKLLRKVKPRKLSAREEKWLSQLEAPFANASAAERQKGQSGAELLAAVLASPGDLGLRAVYGDWLTQHGDPRGELISLQLAAPTEKSQKRINALIKKHWESWVGPLADWFTFGYSRGRMPPAFKAGFPVSGHVNTPKHGAGETLRKLLDRPEWRTFETLEGWPTNAVPLHEALAHPNFAQVRCVSAALMTSALIPLARLAPPLEELKVSLRPEDGEVDLRRFKKLRRLHVHPSDIDGVKHVLSQLDSVHIDRVYAEDLTREHWTTFEKSGVPTVDCGVVVLSRERGAKHFERITIEYAPEPGVLEAMPKTVHSFVVPQVVPVLDDDDLESLRARLKKQFKSLDVSQLPTNAKFKLPPQKHLEFCFAEAKLLDERKVKRVWEILTEEFGATFDTFHPNYASERPLGDAPLEKLLTWSRNKRTTSFYLMREGGETKASLLRDSGYSYFTLPLLDAQRFIGGLRSLVAYAKPKYVEFKKVRVDRGKPLSPIEKLIK